MKPFRVVCIMEANAKPIEGEIYTVDECVEHWSGQPYYGIKELSSDEYYHSSLFRHVDESFGEWVEETIMKEAELETVLINL